MGTVKGWLVRTKEPTCEFFSLGEAQWVTDISKALLFVRKEDADNYFAEHFYPGAQENFEVVGIN